MPAKVAVLIGSAGSGKTTELLRVLERAKAELGGSPFSVGFASMTRAARQEAIERAAAAWNVPAGVLGRDGWFKTAHGICHRQLGIVHGQLITNEKESQVWLADALKCDIRVFLDKDDGSLRYEGDEATKMALTCWNVSRARIEPLKRTIERVMRSGGSVPSLARCVQVIERYEGAKRLENRCDYTDLLARFAGIHFSPEGPFDVEPDGEIPKGVQAWIFDEAQDASALVDRVCRRLAGGPEVKWVYLAGDPFQSIYGFSGSDAKHFMGWPADKKRIMPKSYRCPSPILSLGEWCLRQMHDGYFDREVAPADHDGLVKRGSGADSVVPQLDPNRPTLILCRANYMLDEWAAVLNKRQMPFRRIKEEDETILSRAHKALWQLEKGEPVDPGDFACAMKELPSRSLKERIIEHGMKKKWESEIFQKEWEVILPDDLANTGLTPEGIARIRAGKWDDLVERGDRFRRAAVRWGGALATRPQIRIGSVHSAKGMESEVVVLSTTLTRNIHETKTSDREYHDEECRIEYVGVTRARKELIVSHDPVDYRMKVRG